ncbi:MAG TPA: hypothetical protein VJ785_17185 [Anaerolineales bacterium]|nr:hypothetical protein [Anaerolineales bacterium]
MNNQTRNLIFGTLIGAAMGLASAFLLNRRAQETGTELRISTGDGMKLGVMIIGLLRGIAALGEEK